MATRKKQAIYAENSVQKAVVANERALLDRIRQLVAIESPSDDKKAVDRCVDAVVEMAAAVGGRVRRHRQRAFGDVLELRFGGGGKAERKLAGASAGASGYGLAAGDTKQHAVPGCEGAGVGSGRARHEGGGRDGSDCGRELAGAGCTA